MPATIGITGHRKLEEPARVRNQIDVILEKAIAANNGTPPVAYSSIASGSDTIFAVAALAKGCTLKVVLPMPVADYEKDFAPGAELENFRRLLAVDREPAILNATASLAGNERNEAYLAAGKYITDNCDILVAVWDGQQSAGKGGTGDIVSYARKSGKNVRHIEAYQSDISRLFWKYDSAAKRLKKIYERLWRTSIFLSVAAAWVLAIYLVFHIEQHALLLAFCEFAAVAVSVIIILYLRFGKLNKKRVAVRRAAERLRVIEQFRNGGIPIKVLEKYEEMPDELNQLEIKYQAINAGSGDFEQARTNLLRLVKQQIDYHSKSRPEIKGPTYHRLENVQLPLLYLFFAGVILHLVALLVRHSCECLYHFLHPVSLLLSLFIPPCYAAIEGYIYFKEYPKIHNDSDKMLGFFNLQKKIIEEIDVASENKFELLNAYAFNIMENMDAETKEWSNWFGRPKSPGV